MVVDPDFGGLQLYGMEWDAQRRFWAISIQEIAGFISFRNQRMTEFGEETWESSTDAWAKISDPEKSRHVPSNAEISLVLAHCPYTSDVSMYLLKMGMKVENVPGSLS